MIVSLGRLGLLSISALLLASTTVDAGVIRADANVSERGVNIGWPYGSSKIRGVNLGGWLVLEPWITPSLFEATNNDNIVDEWTFCQLQDKSTATAALKNHWDTWITEADFKDIAAAGLNHVRIGLGFWAWDVSGGEPYIQGQVAYLDKAIGWARTYGLKVLIDLHGGVGSENGYDNSGHKGEALWATDSNNVLRTKNVLNTIAAKYADPAYWQVVTALGLLNEPAGYLNSQLLETTVQFWRDGYGATRWPWLPSSSAQSGLLIVISDAFQPISYWDGFMSEPTYTDVALDTHYYQVFSDAENSWDENTHIAQVCSKASDYANAPLWLMVGEWSLARTDCAKWLNGRGIGSRYDGSYSGSPTVGSCDGFTGDGSNFSR